MTYPDQAELATAGPDIDDEPLLVRPYVRLREHPERPADDAMGGPPPSAGQPEHDDPPVATPERAGPARTGRRIGSALTRHASAVHRGRRRLLSIGSGTLILLLGTTALVLAFGDQSAAPAADVDGAAAPEGSHLATGAAPASPPSPAADLPANPLSTTGASSPPGSPPGSVPPPLPSDGVQPSGSPVPDEQPVAGPPPPAGTRTGRITSVSGLCLDGDAGPRADRIRRWDCDGSSGQTWTVAADGTVQALARCLQASGDRVTLQTCDGGPAQQWRPGTADSLVNPASGRCLSGPDDDEGSRASLRMAACNQSDGQRWTLP
ncbi:RICIN domain-containing protein [Dactylosporangium sp. NPDC005572]|uniref:RICIN domain-containing protein n=1 Tax=Dactylosporangium sp. NPDC005572 TaxID=3156889 RepID=UPI0033A913A9